jgi:UDP:flavonoid glycosyltransferase YjiC (YdhE family)
VVKWADYRPTHVLLEQNPLAHITGRTYGWLFSVSSWIPQIGKPNSKMAKSKPLVLVGTTPIYGHTMPLRAVAQHLVSTGYMVKFLTGHRWRPAIEAIGATFVPLSERADYPDHSQWADIPPPPSDPTLPSTEFIQRYFFCGMIPEQHASIQSILESVSKEDPERKTVVLCDQSFWGAFPSLLGAKGLKPAGVLALGIVPIMLSSVDTPPFGLGLAPGSESRESMVSLTEKVYKEDYGGTQTDFLRILQELGVAQVPNGLHAVDAQYLLPDRFLQMCVPSVEWPRSDLPKTVQFAGNVPRGHRDKAADLPEWWSEISDNKEGKTIVAVSQGTLLADNISHLIVPTISALKDIPSILLIVALGKKGAVLPAHVVIPANTRVCDFVPFDDLFPFCDVFVTNGGYGGFNHALSHGLPMVIAGVQTDKPEVAARGEWAGVAVNLRTETPTSEEVKEAVFKVIENPSYRERAKSIEKEMENYDLLGMVVKTIEELAAAET